MTAVVTVAVIPMWLSCVIGWAMCVVPMLAVERLMRGAQMTEPLRIPPNGLYGPYFGIPKPTFCTRCEIHAATTHKPLCPVCLDDEAREIRDGK